MLYRNPNAVAEPIRKIVNKWRQRNGHQQQQQQQQEFQQKQDGEKS